jgi:hypothetical protein
MLSTIARRVATKAIVRGAVAMGAVMSVEGVHFTDLRGKLPVRQDVRYAVRDESRIEGAVFHHTATNGQTLRSIAQYHIEARKWPAIAYHYAIGYDGHIFLLNDPTTISYHTQGYNSRTISIVLIGNYQNNELSREMKNSIVVLSSYLNTLYDLQFMWMHSETKSTACPGNYAKEYLQPMLHGPRP